MDTVQEEKARLFRIFETDALCEYVRFITLEHFLEYDECGNACGWGEVPDYFIKLQGDDYLDYPLPRSRFDTAAEIQATLEIIGIDPNKLWEAIRIIRYISELEFVDVPPVLPALGPQVEEVIKALEQDNSKIRVYRDKTSYFTLSSKMRDYLRDILVEDYKAKRGTPFYYSTVLIHENTSYGTYKQMAYEAELLMEIFNKFCTDQELPRRTKKGAPSRDKLLLTSRLLYLTGLTMNENYWKSKDSLKGIINRYSTDTTDKD